jgi:hypothetical protein
MLQNAKEELPRRGSFLDQSDAESVGESLSDCDWDVGVNLVREPGPPAPATDGSAQGVELTAEFLVVRPERPDYIPDGLER